MNPRDLPDDDEPGFLRRNIVMIILGLLALGGGGYLYANHKPAKATKSKKLDMVMVMPVVAPPPPPPPPPPPKKEEPPPEEEKKEEEMAAEEEPPPDAQEKPADKPADDPIGTAIAGGDGTGLGLGTGSGIGGSGGGIGGRTYSERGRWQGKFGRSIQDLLARNQELKFAKGSVTFRVWLDESGRITRVALNGTTGDPKMDDVLRNRALTGQVLDPAPAGTPMPVIMRFNGR